MTLYGNAVVIDHGYGLLSLCGHMASLDVEAGEAVARGQIIGASGATGLAGGDHLHLEIFIQGQSVDPIEWFDAKWIRDNLGSKLAVPVE
jgi:murein DD-endopeptidase MepM/ murein hydrolase activator NlpD